MVYGYSSYLKFHLEVFGILGTWDFGASEGTQLNFHVFFVF